MKNHNIHFKLRSLSAWKYNEFLNNLRFSNISKRALTHTSRHSYYLIYTLGFTAVNSLIFELYYIPYHTALEFLSLVGYLLALSFYRLLGILALCSIPIINEATTIFSFKPHPQYTHTHTHTHSHTDTKLCQLRDGPRPKKIGIKKKKCPPKKLRWHALKTQNCLIMPSQSYRNGIKMFSSDWP